VIHFDTELDRTPYSWVRGTNRYLPLDIAVQWAREMPREFHCRGSAIARRYAYVVLESAVRPSVEVGRVGWVYRPLDLAAMQQAAQYVMGEHDFTSFRASSCQALTPVKTMTRIDITRKSTQTGSAVWRFEFEASAFLHHMIRNLMGCFLQIGQGMQSAQWMADVLAAKNRDAAAPTFSPDGLYFLGPVYEDHWGLPARTPAYDWLP
jgi:tRNA pseudouridine38-40 synthase